MKPTARKLDIVLSSAANLKKMSTVTRTAAYAVAWIEPSVRVPSPMDRRHGCNPVWDATISIPLNERVLSQPAEKQRLHIELLGQGLVSTKPIGFVSVDMTEIFLQGSEGAAVKAPFHEYPVRRRSGRQQGIINFELCLQAAAPSTTSTSKSQKGFAAAAGSSSNSAPTLPQSYQREILSSMEPQRNDMQRSHDFFRESRMARSEVSTSRHSGTYDVAEHDEISLLDSYDHVRL